MFYLFSNWSIHFPFKNKYAHHQAIEAYKQNTISEEKQMCT